MALKAVARTRTVGGSLVVAIPKEIVKEQGLHAGELVELEVKKPKRSYFGIAKGVGPFTKKDELTAHE